MEENDFFAGNPSPRIRHSAPGRLDVMGGIADYSGSLVLQMPIRERTVVMLALRNDTTIRVRTQQPVSHPLFETDWRQLLVTDDFIDYQRIRKILTTLPGGDWAAYAVGCLVVLAKEKGVARTGIDIWIDSQVPPGKGVSSSAALEVAVIRALAEAHQLTFTGTELPVLAQKAENRVAGAPCGLMDQLACHFGEPGKLLPILCQPDHVSDAIPLPEGVRFVGIDSGVRHAVGGGTYGTVRTAAFMGYTLMALYDGAYPHELQRSRDTGQRDHLLYNGYLANLTPREFEDRYAWLPAQFKGGDFIEKYSVTIDPVTEVRLNVTYPVLQAARHPVYENTRVQYFSLLLQHLPPTTDPPAREKALNQLGAWMYQSHDSYSACGLGSEQTDELVRLVRDHAGQGVYGAKITGGGGGGTVCVLCDGAKGLETVRRIHESYQQRHGVAVHLFV